VNGKKLKRDSQFDCGQKLTSVLIRLAQDAESIDAEAAQADTQAAVETLQTLQSQLEDVRAFYLILCLAPKLN
jgi:signal transduction histidine kinase